MSYQILVLMPEQDLEQGVYSRGGLSSGRNSTVVGVLGAIVLSDTHERVVYHGTKDPRTGLLKPLETHTIYEMANMIRRRTEEGIYTVTWNGLVEIFEPLAKIAPDDRTRRMWEEIALEHIDIAFGMFCARGFTTNLGGVLEGMNIPDRIQALDAFTASQNWNQSYEVQATIFRILYERALTLSELYKRTTKSQRLAWLSSTKSAAWWKPDLVIAKDGSVRLLTVRESLQLPEPDVSWMQRKFHRTRMDFCAWMPGFTRPVQTDEEDAYEIDSDVEEDPDAPVGPESHPTTRADGERLRGGGPIPDSPVEQLFTGNPENVVDDGVILHMKDPVARKYLRLYAEEIKGRSPEAALLAQGLLDQLKNYSA